LYLFGARDYDPTTGRWDEEDPAGYINGASQYQFVESNPTSALDPSGLGLLSYLYTGEWNASDDLYAAATEGGGDAYIENAGLLHSRLSSLSRVPEAGMLASLTNDALNNLEGSNLHNTVMNPKAAAAASNNHSGSAKSASHGPPAPSGRKTTPTTEGEDGDGGNLKASYDSGDGDGQAGDSDPSQGQQEQGDDSGAGPTGPQPPGTYPPPEVPRPRYPLGYDGPQLPGTYPEIIPNADGTKTIIFPPPPAPTGYDGPNPIGAIPAETTEGDD
jgi:hypothetical protein